MEIVIVFLFDVALRILCGNALLFYKQVLESSHFHWHRSLLSVIQFKVFNQKTCDSVSLWTLKGM